ncbi:MAG: hypothetical protein JXR49_11300 [Acidobacteria bacterium]|nr:hypothetical protein [Acidobacteriota bacterium]
MPSDPVGKDRGKATCRPGNVDPLNWGVPVVAFTAIVLFFIITATASAQEVGQQGSVWNLGTLQQKVYPSTVSAENRSCPGSHTFEFSVAREATQFLSITGPEVLSGVAMGTAKATDVVFDLRKTAPGPHNEGSIIIRCLDCPVECRQDYQELNIHLTVVGPPEEIRSTPREETQEDDSPMQCSDPTFKSDAGEAIKVKLVSGTPLTDFPYPRPIPLQAVARDFDILEVGCEGCAGGKSNLRQPIEDTVSYEWKLTGEGSINKPFVDTDLDKVLDQIEQLLKEIQRLSEEIAEKEEQKRRLDGSRDQRRNDIQAEIDRLRERKLEAEKELLEIESRIAALDSRISEKENEIVQRRQEKTDFEQQIEEKENRIQELQDKIRGEPSPEERQLAARLEQIEQNIESKQNQLEQLRQENASREQALHDSYNQAEAELDRARKNLANLSGQVQALQDEITALENSLYTNPLLKDIFTKRATISRGGQLLKQDYFPNNPLPVSPANNALDLANRLLQAPASQKQGLLDQYSSERERLINQLDQACSGLSGAEAGSCSEGVDQLAEDMESLEDSLQQSVEQPAGIDTQKLEQLKEKREQLERLNGDITAAEQQVKAAEQAADAAYQGYVNGLKDLERQEQDLLNEIARLQEESVTVSAELSDAQRRSAREREENTPQWLEEIAQLRSEIEELTGRINDARRDIERMQRQLNTLTGERDEKRARKQALEEYIALLDEKIADKEQEKADLDNESANLQKEIDRLKAELKAQEAQLEQLKQKLTKETRGNKDAGEQQIYFIPPPLEKIMKNPGRFEKLKREITKKEVELADAIGKKAELQKRAFEILQGMTQQLWILKGSQKLSEELEKEIQDLDFSKREMETDFKRDNLEKLGREQQEKARLEQDKQQVEQDLAKRKEEEAQQKGDVEVAEAAVETCEQEVSRAEEDVFARINAVQLEKQKRQRKAEIVAEQRSAHEQTLARLRQQEAELGRIEDSIARAVATGNETGAANLRQAAEVAKRELKSIQEQSRLEKQELDAVAADLSLATVAEKEAEKAEAEAQKTLLDAQRNLRRARQDMRKQTEEADQATERRLAEERKVRQADERVKEQDQKIQDTNKEIEDGAAATQDVQTARKDIDRKTKEKEEADNTKAKAKNELQRLIERREQWKKDRDGADMEVKAARDALETAEQNLKTFLVEEELKKVSRTFTLTLEVDDENLDKWRSDDSPVTRTVTIEYVNRIPQVRRPDDDLTMPAKTHTPARCDTALNFIEESPIEPPDPPKPVALKKEPQTIALYYRKGEHLYEHWPPRRENNNALTDAANEWCADASDLDRFSAQCASQGEYGQSCISGNPTMAEVIQDPPHFEWDGVVNYTSKEEARLYIKVPQVPDNLCSNKNELEVVYSDSSLQAIDREIKGKESFLKFPGVVGDHSETVRDFDEQNKVELKVQLFDGAHKGLKDEVIEWKVGGAGPDIPDEKFGFESDKKKELIEKTDGSGYSKVDFYLEEHYGKATVTATWKRADSACGTVTIQVARLLELKMLKVGFAAKEGWDAAEKLFSGTESDVEKLAGELPDSTDTGPFIATGLRDDQKDPVDEKKILFSIEESRDASMDPAEMATKIYGLAWSFARDLPEDSPEEAKAEMKAKVEEPLKDYTNPPEVEGSQSTATTTRFLIGREGAYLIIETEEAFVPGGDPYTGGAKLIISGESANIPAEFAALALSASGIEVGKPDGDATAVATAGSVSWHPEGGGNGLEFTKGGFSLKLTSLGLTAGADGQISGKVRVPRMEEEADFSATIGPGGFLGEAGNFPEIELAGMKLEKGAAVVVDMHRTEDPDPQPEGWMSQGLLIRQGKIILPDALKGRRDTPPALSVKNLIVNSSGLSGEISLEYELSASLGSMQFAINKVNLKLVQNEPTGTTLEGAVTLPDPFIGTVGLTLTIQRGNSYGLELTTEKPVAAPRLGLVFDIQSMGARYEEEVFSFNLSAILKSENFSDITIQNFKFNSNGEFEAEKISINKDIEFARGFSIHLKEFGFKKTAEEFGLSLSTRFQFGEILTADEVAVSIAEGPVIEEFDLKIHANRAPVGFGAEIHYKANLFEGAVKVDVKNLFSIDGNFVMGSMEPPEEDPWSFWYVELNSSVAIPLGQTGLSITRLGGGVGYNYDPPIGSANGAPRKTDAFAFKASITIGNVPNGKVFAGRVSLVLVTDRFSLNGKVWLLDQEDSLFGEGRLNVHWAPTRKLDGFVRMVIALPDSDGELLRFNGQVDFLFAGSNNWRVKSRTLEGAILERVLAEGTIDIKPGEAHLDGNMRYDLYKEVSLAVVTLKVQVNLRADGSLSFVVTDTSTSLDASARFRGQWDVNLDTAVKEFDIVSGSLSTSLELSASNSRFSISGEVEVSWDTWVHSGSAKVDIGYEQ